jgi:hypothetical protein
MTFGVLYFNREEVIVMKKIPLGLIFMLLAVDSWALSSLQVEEGYRTRPSREAVSAAPREGLHREYYEDGTLKSEVGYKDGQIDGRCRLYYKNGNLRRQFYYHNGAVNGKAFEFYENGQYKVEGNYKNGVVDDVNKFYYENGNLYSFMVYQNGMLLKNYVLDPAGRTIKDQAR